MDVYLEWDDFTEANRVHRYEVDAWEDPWAKGSRAICRDGTFITW